MYHVRTSINKEKKELLFFESIYIRFLLFLTTNYNPLSIGKYGISH